MMLWWLEKLQCGVNLLPCQPTTTLILNKASAACTQNKKLLALNERTKQTEDLYQC